MTPEKIILKKQYHHISGNILKWIMTEQILIIENLIHILRYMINKMKDKIQLFQMSLKKTQ